MSTEAVLDDPILVELADIKRQLAEVRAALTTTRPVDPSVRVLNRSEVKKLTGHKSDSALDRWLSEQDIKPCYWGHYLQESIELGLRMAAARKKR